MNAYRLIVNLLNFIAVIALVIRPLKIKFPTHWKYIGDRTLTIGLGLAPLLGVVILLIIQGITATDAGNF